MRAGSGFVLASLVGLAGGTGAAGGAEVARQESTRWVMGTALRVVVDAGSSRSLDPLFASAMQWESWLSHYRDDSLVAELQRRAPVMLEVPRPVFDYFERSRRDHVLTDGRFDILHATPADRDRWNRLRLSKDGDPPRVGLGEGLVVDPGGNGKGYAVQAMVDSLRAWRVERALIDFGGSSWAAVGAPRHAEAWTVEIVGDLGERLGTVALADAALSISQTRLRGDDARAHIVDPASGRPVSAGRTALVRSADSVDAEVLSTTLVVGGVDAFVVLDRYRRVEAVLLDAEGVHRYGPCEWFTPRSSTGSD